MLRWVDICPVSRTTRDGIPCFFNLGIASIIENRSSRCNGSRKTVHNHVISYSKTMAQQLEHIHQTQKVPLEV